MFKNIILKVLKKEENIKIVSVWYGKVINYELELLKFNKFMIKKIIKKSIYCNF